MSDRKLTVVQMLPALNAGGVERGTLELGRYLVEQGHRSIVISAGGRMLPQLKAEGSEHLDWDVGKKSLWTLRWIKRVRQFLEEEKPDILHLRSRLPAWIGYRAWKKMSPDTRPKLVTTVHGPYTPGRYSSVMVRGERVIAISNMIRRYILENYPTVDENIIRIIFRGVSTKVYYPGYQPDDAWLNQFRQQYPGLESRFVLCFPARITRWKGQEHFIEVVRLLKQQGVPVFGLIVGEPHRKKQHFMQELLQLVEQYELQQDIAFTGHRTDVKEIMAVSDVVLSLALDPEAFGRTTIEAMSLGIPVVAYDHGGVAEQLQQLLPDGLVPLNDIEGAAAKLAQWYQAKPVVGENTGFTLEQMVESTLNVYRELVK